MKNMTMKRLVSAISKYEGKKHQASVGDIREILKIIATLEGQSIDGNFDGPIPVLIDYALDIREKRGKKKKC